MAKKKTIRTIPQARTPMPEQSPEARVKNFDEVACGYRLEDALRRGGPLPALRRRALRQGLPGRHRHPGLHPEDGGEELPRRLRHDHRHQPAAVGLRPRLPAGEPVRGRVHGRRHARAGGDRTPRALRRRHGHPRRLGQRALHRAEPASRSASSARGRREWPAPPTWPRPAARSSSTRRSTSPAAC